MVYTMKKTKTQRAITGKRLLLCTIVQQCCGKDSTEGLIVILCRDWALSRPGWLASLHTWQAEGCLGWGRGSAPQGGWDVTEITREHEASVSLQSFLLTVRLKRWTLVFLMWQWSVCVSQTLRCLNVMFLWIQLEAKGVLGSDHSFLSIWTTPWYLRR